MGDGTAYFDAPEIMSPESRHTFLFADISGFTALTEAHGDEEAADLAESFAAEARLVVAEHQGDHVKTIGDALMIRVPDAASAVQLGLIIVFDLMARHGAPAVRVGMHHGPAVERAGDWFGASVNLAARISAAASGGEVLLSAATREAAGTVDGVHFEERGRRSLRNVTEPVALYSARRQGHSSARGLPIDPVCRMAVDPETAAGQLTHQEVEYHFCSLECAASFAASPNAYAGIGEASDRPAWG